MPQAVDDRLALLQQTLDESNTKKQNLEDEFSNTEKKLTRATKLMAGLGMLQSWEALCDRVVVRWAGRRQVGQCSIVTCQKMPQDRRDHLWKRRSQSG